MFLLILLALILINVFATISENELFQQMTKPLFVPVFLIYFLLGNKKISPIIFIFLAFSFIGDFTSVFTNEILMVEVSSLFYCLSYISLIVASVLNIKKLKLDKIIGMYLVVVFVINSYLLFILFDTLKYHIPDSVEITLFGVKSVSLLVLAFIAFVNYLNTDSKQSIQFLVMSLCFVFSDVLYYVSTYYMYNWSFVMLDRVLHVIGLFFLFNLILEKNIERRRQSILAQKMSLRRAYELKLK
ncbi:lysoplasmalogenase family protein [Lacinutrix iliipiscaria]|uniref:Lysoplasmalogenase family protein n=1 Tax=Lacinutrix iliipiscaria TaxID=1230532 RepID=A0ABW5WNP1_9FLAO